MSAPDTTAAIAAAIEQALAKPGPFLVMPATLRLTEGARQAFAAAAEQHGRRLGMAPYSPAAEAAARTLAADTPTVSRHDHRAFLQNVSKIAKGQVRCE